MIDEILDSIGGRLIHVRGSKSRTDFAAEIGVHQNTLGNYERNDRMPDADLLNKLIDAGYSANWILSGGGSKNITGEMQISDQASSYTVKADDFIYVDMWSVEVSAGHGAQIDQEVVISRAAFRREWVDQEGLDKNRLALIVAKGDSMEPTIIDGDSILTSIFMHTGEENEIKQGLKSNSELPNEGIYLVRLDGHLFVKRLQADMQGGLKIISDNTAYEAIHLNKSSAEEITIVGKVEWIGRRV